MTEESKIGTREQRQKRIGGSEFGTVLDINPYNKRIDLILEKAGVIKNVFNGNEATRRGELLEDEVIQMFEKETGLKVTNQQEEFKYKPNFGLELVCHVDGLTEDAVFEAKTTDIKSKTWKDGIPAYYQAQLEFNCFLANYKKAYIAVAFCDDVEIKEFKYFEYIPRMTREEILRACLDFSMEVAKYKELGIINSGKIKVADEANNDLINRLLEINEEISKIKQTLNPLETEKKNIETQLKLQIQNDMGIETSLYQVTLGNRVTSPCSEYKITRSGLKIELKGN